MGWATDHIRRLLNGETVSFRPRGNSMSGRVESGQLCTVEPLGETPIKVGEIVLCKVGGDQYLHLVKAVQGNRVQIGNNHNHINGWTPITKVFGRLVKVAP